MSIPIWIKSEYVTIGIALLFSSGGLSPSEKSEGKPPGSVVSHMGSIAYAHVFDNYKFTVGAGEILRIYKNDSFKKKIAFDKKRKLCYSI